jgi:formylglycine-generating enzyme required for sulfatase activity
VSEANQPVVEVSWLDAMRFCDWLNAARQHPQAARKVQWPDHLANCQATLPTEAQWERACRGVAGEGPVEQEYGSGDGAAALATVGWFGLDWNSKIPAVGGKQPTDWGLYDMHGLVWEWVLDEYEADAYGHRPEITIDPLQGAGAKPAKRSADALRVLRGGSWLNSAADCRSAFRDRFRAGVRVRDGGFRVALVPGPSRAPP